MVHCIFVYNNYLRENSKWEKIHDSKKLVEPKFNYVRDKMPIIMNKPKAF